ncbi:MAG TPA: UDP-N-acetylglucosamine 1-carboxyvinyltransferase, partial [Candidatus Paceibacterota bacterium]|nr:UDP-N-acetylglucosamine 1-carboxyvinyltransferase [Candidatus Paceibacterota bacterium]
MSEHFFKIQGLAGEKKLQGEISVGGAKNAALKVMASALLFTDHVEITNIPEIEDVARIGELLEGLGAKIESSKNKRKIILPEKLKTDLLHEPAQATRSSIVLTGPLLARMGRVSFPNPGGCNFGNRPIDLFLEGFRKMGAVIKEEGESYVATAPNGLIGTEFFFKVQSHT